jgi:starch synthase
VKTLLPGYPAVLKKVKKPKEVAAFNSFFGGKAKVVSAVVDGLDLLVLDAPHLFDRAGGLYIGEDGHDWPDNPERFAALSYAAAHVARNGVGKWKPQVVHGHDWQAGFVSEYLNELEAGSVPFVFTIHNIAFHGNTGADRLGSLGLSDWRFTADHFEFWGQISALKAGLMGADRITTVSKTYAEELMTPEFGMGMDGVLRARRADLTGIVNGIDTATWDPNSDPAIKPYKTAKGKGPNKTALRKEFGLSKSDGPLCVLISRLTHQKGIDLVLEALPTLLGRGGQLALLGSGDTALEVALLERAASEPNVAVKIGYDEALSHRMIAGGDAILVPSRFEPCGLTQLYGLRYGTIPLVALTGGLADTVINASPAALAQGVATGIQFRPITAESLSNAFNRLCDLYSDAKAWGTLQKNAMKQPVGWETSASEYSALYTELVKG